MKAFGKIIKIIFTSVILLLCALFIGRIFLLTDKSVLAEISPDEINRAAYSSSGGKLTLLTHKQYDELSKEGLFGSYALVYIKEAKQLQFTVRYNDSIYKYTDYAEGTEFTYFLYNTKTEEYIAASRVDSAERFMYNYNRLVFDGIDTELGGDWYLYVSADGIAESSFDSLPMHYENQSFDGYKLSGSERAELSAK